MRGGTIVQEEEYFWEGKWGGDVWRQGGLEVSPQKNERKAEERYELERIEQVVGQRV